MPRAVVRLSAGRTELSEEAHRREQELLRGAVSEADVVITTALVPGRPAPAPGGVALASGAERRDHWSFVARTPGTAVITASARTTREMPSVVRSSR